MTIVLLLIVIVQIVQGFARSSAVLGDTAMTSDVVLSDTNDERIERDIAPLVMNDQLNEAAALKAQDMLTHQYWAHTSPGGVTPWQWLGKVGYGYAYAGENLAKNFTDAGSLTAAWMASSEHRANILNAQYTQAGLAVKQGLMNGQAVTLVVALYAAPDTAVAGVQQRGELAAQPGLLARFGAMLYELTPASLAGVVLTLVAVIVALGAHVYRGRLPKGLRATWYRHHGLVKAGGMTGLCLVVLFLYGGQI